MATQTLCVSDKPHAKNATWTAKLDWSLIDENCVVWVWACECVCAGVWVCMGRTATADFWGKTK